MVGYFEGSLGAHGFMLSPNGVYTAIQVPGVIDPIPTGINDQGQIVGYFVSGNHYQDFLLSSNGTYTPINVPGAGSYGTSAPAINNLGQIVGLYADSTGHAYGFLRDVNGQYTTINVPGSQFTEATGINDQGQIVGYYANSNGVEYGFEAISVPEPSTFPVAIISSLLGIGYCWHQKRNTLTRARERLRRLVTPDRSVGRV